MGSKPMTKDEIRSILADATETVLEQIEIDINDAPLASQVCAEYDFQALIRNKTLYFLIQGDKIYGTRKVTERDSSLAPMVLYIEYLVKETEDNEVVQIKIAYENFIKGVKNENN